MHEGLPRLGTYSVLEHLATGGMAEVYLARKIGPVGFEKLVVLKRVRAELTNDARTTGLLVYAIDHVDDSYVIVMEYVQGADLRNLLEVAYKTGRPISLDDAVYIISHVCAALHYAHEKRDADDRPLEIIHRDISPSNVLVSYDGAVKVCDFGIATGRNRTTETLQGALKGKLSYMSPEQCKSDPLDRRSDVFAIGILLYELSTSTKLFRANSEFELLRTIVQDPIPPPSKRIADYPEALEAIVMRALAKEPADRYPTAQALQEDLEAFAREHKLVMSSIHIAKLMESLFAKPSSGQWRAQHAGSDPDTEINTRVVQSEVVAEGSNRVTPARPITIEERGGNRHDAKTEPRVAQVARRPLAAMAAMTAMVRARGGASGAKLAKPVSRVVWRARRVRPSLLWLIAALLVGSAAIAIPYVVPPKTPSLTDAEQLLRGDAERLATTIDAAGRASQLEVDRLAASPQLRAAISIDAATVRDFGLGDRASSAPPSEVIEVFQRRDGALTSLLRMPADAAPLPTPVVNTALPRLTSDATGMRLIATAPIAGAGAVTSSVPVDLAIVQQSLGRTTRGARLVGVTPEVTLVDTPTDTMTVTSVRIAAPSKLHPTLAIAATLDATVELPAWCLPAQIAAGVLTTLLVCTFLLTLARRLRA